MQTMRIYVHRAGVREPEAVDADAGTLLGEALGLRDGNGIVLREDEDDALDPSLSLQDAGLRDRDHVFAGAKPKISVDVAFNGESINERFSSSTRVERVFKWATGKRGFDLDKADAAEHMLVLRSTQDAPPPDAHLGTLDETSPGHVLFDLVPKRRFEG